ncbi:MAG: hypothetical protein D6823_00230 [Chloroflexi bacterium]|nr:MAG: hypothetical protein D6823_00230 [Chloroflexota bacterium]
MNMATGWGFKASDIRQSSSARRNTLTSLLITLLFSNRNEVRLGECIRQMAAFLLTSTRGHGQALVPGMAEQIYQALGASGY